MDNPEKARHSATSSQLSQVPWSFPVASSTTVYRGGYSGSPRKWSERSYDRRAHGSHRAAPCEGAPQSVQRQRARRSAYSRRRAAFFLGERRASIAAQGPQRETPSKVDRLQRPHSPASRLSAYLRFPIALRVSRQRSQDAAPSTGRSRPHRRQDPAARRASWRFLGVLPAASALGLRVSAPVGLAGGLGPGVAGSLGRAPLVRARLAQGALGCGRRVSATNAQTGLAAFVDPPAVAAAFRGACLLGIPAWFAGGPDPGVPGAAGPVALLATGFAHAAPGHGRTLATTGTQALRPAFGGALPEAIAVLRSTNFEILVGHRDSPYRSWNPGEEHLAGEGPAGRPHGTFSEERRSALLALGEKSRRKVAPVLHTAASDAQPGADDDLVARGTHPLDRPCATRSRTSPGANLSGSTDLRADGGSRRRPSIGSARPRSGRPRGRGRAGGSGRCGCCREALGRVHRSVSLFWPGVANGGDALSRTSVRRPLTARPSLRAARGATEGVRDGGAREGPGGHWRAKPTRESGFEQRISGRRPVRTRGEVGKLVPNLGTWTTLMREDHLRPVFIRPTGGADRHQSHY